VPESGVVAKTSMVGRTTAPDEREGWRTGGASWASACDAENAKLATAIDDRRNTVPVPPMR
jgi:hypothetical protein